MSRDNLSFAALGVLALTTGFAGPSQAQQAVVQFGPTTDLSTITCLNFAKSADGAWHAVRGQKFGLGFVQGIIPPATPIKSGGFIYNNIDLFSQLELQCGAGVVVARY